MKRVAILAALVAMAACGGEPPANDVEVAKKSLTGTVVYGSSFGPSQIFAGINSSYMQSVPIGAGRSYDIDGTTNVYPLAISERARFLPGTGGSVFDIVLAPPGGSPGPTYDISCALHVSGAIATVTPPNQSGFFPSRWINTHPWAAWFGFADGSVGGTCAYSYAGSGYPGRAVTMVRILPSQSIGGGYLSQPPLNDWSSVYVRVDVPFPEAGVTNRYFLSMVQQVM